MLQSHTYPPVRLAWFQLDHFFPHSWFAWHPHIGPMLGEFNLSSGLKETLFWPKNGIRSNPTVSKFPGGGGGGGHAPDSPGYCILMHLTTSHLITAALIMKRKQHLDTWKRGYVCVKSELYPADRSTRKHMMRMRHSSTKMMNPHGTPTIIAMVR